MSEEILLTHNNERLAFESGDLLGNDLWILYEHLNKSVNSNQFDAARDIACKLDLLLAQELGVTSQSSLNELIEALQPQKLLSVFDSVVSAVSFISGLFYAQALTLMLGEKDYQASRQRFSLAFRFLQDASLAFEVDLVVRQRLWRSAYHEGLSAFLGNDFDGALSIFERFFVMHAFAQELCSMDDKRLACITNGGELVACDTYEVPSDVVSGVLYYCSQSLIKLEDYERALPLLRAAAALAGNPISSVFQGLAESKLPECYQGLIRKSTFGGKSAWASSGRLAVTFHNRQSFPAKTILSAAAQPVTHSIAAIIPVYNGAKLVSQTLRSVVEQTQLATELIIVDDGSEDDSFEVISNAVRQLNFPHDVIIIRVMNGGQSRARNIGAVAATSNILAYLDQDDLWYPEHLEILQKPFRKNANLGWTYSDLDEVDLSGKMMHRKFLNVVAPNRCFNTVRDFVHTDMFVLPSASLISRRALIAINGFDEDLSGYEDDDLFVRLFRDGFEHVFVDVPLSQWRIHQGSCSYQMRMVISRRKFQMKLMAMFPDDPAMGRFWVRDVISPRFFANGSNRFNVGIETNDHSMCAEALTDMKTSMKTMTVPIRTRLRVMMCHFPVLYKRFKALQTNSRYR